MRFFFPVAVAVAALAATPALAQSKGKGRPPAAVTITNATDTPTREVVIQAGEQTARLAKPLAPQAKASLRLPAKLKGCFVSVSAVFEDDGRAEIPEHDVCKDRAIRFTN